MNSIPTKPKRSRPLLRNSSGPRNAAATSFRQDILDDYRGICLRNHGLITMKVLIDDLERHLIRRALEMTHGNQRRAAGLLGLKYTTLNEKVRRLGLRIPSPTFNFWADAPGSWRPPAR